MTILLAAGMLIGVGLITMEVINLINAIRDYAKHTN